MKLDRTSLVNQTFDHFAGFGYLRIEEEPLIPAWDPSLLFTNSAVVAFKKYLLGAPVPGNGVVLCQRCVRAHQIGDVEASGELLSIFSMMGVFTRDGAAIMNQSVAFWRAIIDVPWERLRLRLDPEDTELVQTYRQISGAPEIELGGMPKDSYDWTFGIEGVTGSGGHFSFVQNDGSIRDIANIIQIRGRSGTLGFGFGFGVEAALWAMYGVPLLGQVASFSQVFDVSSPQQMRLADLGALLLRLWREGVTPRKTKHGYIAKKSLKSFVSLCRTLGKKPSLLLRAMERLEQLDYGSNSDAPARLCAMAEEYLNSGVSDNVVRRDLSFLCNPDIDPAALAVTLHTAIGAAAREVTLFDRYEGPTLPAGKISLAYRAYVGSIGESEIHALLARAVAAAKRVHGATLRGAHLAESTP